MLPQWIQGLFGNKSEVPARPDTSTNIHKKAHSELIEAILTDKPLEVVAEDKKCPGCDKPNQFGEQCVPCLEAEKDAYAQRDTVAAPRVSLEAELQKEAGAYELGDSEVQTARKSHEAQVKAASDSALAEMLTEIHLKGQGVQENWSTEYPKVLADVKKNRKSAEKELLEETPIPAVLDRMKFLAEIMDQKFEATESKNLYGELFEATGKQSWEKAKNAWKDEAPSEKEQLENQMPEGQGPGREEEDHRGLQAPRSTTAGVHDLDDLQMIPQDKFLVHYNKIEGGEKYFKWFDTKEAADVYAESLKKTDFAVNLKMKDYSKQFEEKPAETLQKQADIPSPWKVVKQDKEEVIARVAPIDVVKESAESKDKPSTQKKASGEANKCPKCFLPMDGAECEPCSAPHKLVPPDLEARHKMDLQLEAQVSKLVSDIESKASLALTAKEDLGEPAPSLEGLDAHEQELWKKHFQTAFRWALADPMSRKVGRSETRQAAMIALLRAIRTYDPSHASSAKFESYLFRAVHNELITRLVKERSIKDKDPEKFISIDQPISEGDRMYEADTLQDIIPDVSEKTPEQHLDRAEQAAVAKKVMELAEQQIKGNDKDVLDLFIQGYNVTEIAELKGWTIPNAVRYRKKLAVTLEKILNEVLKQKVDFKHESPEEAPEAEQAEAPAVEKPAEEPKVEAPAPAAEASLVAALVFAEIKGK